MPINKVIESQGVDLANIDKHIINSLKLYSPPRGYTITQIEILSSRLDLIINIHGYSYLYNKNFVHSHIKSLPFTDSKFSSAMDKSIQYFLDEEKKDIAVLDNIKQYYQTNNPDLQIDEYESTYNKFESKDLEKYISRSDYSRYERIKSRIKKTFKIYQYMNT